MLKRRRVTTAEESVGAGEETDPLLLEALGQPVVLIQVDGGREGEGGANPHERAAPGPIVDEEVVLVHPARLVEPMPWLGGPFTDTEQDASGLAGFANGHDPVGLGVAEIRVQELIPAFLFRRFQDRSSPLARGVLDQLWYGLATVRSTFRLPG